MTLLLALLNLKNAIPDLTFPTCNWAFCSYGQRVRRTWVRCHCCQPAGING
jgi:hypothetical protein